MAGGSSGWGSRGVGDGLNPEQERAAASLHGPVMVLAGAGSGKTRVITARLSRLLAAGVEPAAIVALTFTNKAAAEMRRRAGIDRTGARAVRRGRGGPTVCTFHAFGLQVVRRYAAALGFGAGAGARLTVYDQHDSAQLLREVAAELRLDGDSAGGDPAHLQRLVSAVRMGDAAAGARLGPGVDRLIARYRQRLLLHRAVDFDDLILLPLELLRGEHGAALRARHTHLLVDEFQDTSTRQYQVLHALTATSRNVCVVGDDDQSIYSWRGADATNFERFSRDFPERLEIKLEQNYRSTGTILNLANAIIGHNRARRPKRLWSAGGAGAPVTVAHPADETDEAEWIAGQIRTLAVRARLRYADCGVLVRANSLMRAVEEAFLRERIPYQVSGGVSFFTRREVRDLIAYLRVLANPDDDVSLRRILNVPRRGLGAAALERVTGIAGARRCSLYGALAALRAGAVEPDGAAGDARQRAAVGELVELLDEFGGRMRAAAARPGAARGARTPGMAAVLAELVEAVGYRDHLVGTERAEVVRWKLGNVDSLVGSLADFEERSGANGHGPPALVDYLARTALVNRDDDTPGDADDARGRVWLMTVHAAKGLEFDTTFIAGADDGQIPHARSLAENEANLEEERRLFYVAVTRARRRLFITIPASRGRRWAAGTRPTEHPTLPSRFLTELPPDLVLDVGDGARDADAEELTPDEASALFRDLKRRLGAAR